jgi:hypothetical protein
MFWLEPALSAVSAGPSPRGKTHECRALETVIDRNTTTLR